MVAAIWSMPFSKAKDMPLKLFLNFFINHGLFKLKNRPQWYTVSNRSKTYVGRVAAWRVACIYSSRLHIVPEPPQSAHCPLPWVSRLVHCPPPWVSRLVRTWALESLMVAASGRAQQSGLLCARRQEHAGPANLVESASQCPQGVWGGLHLEGLVAVCRPISRQGCVRACHPYGSEHVSTLRGGSQTS